MNNSSNSLILSVCSLLVVVQVLKLSVTRCWQLVLVVLGAMNSELITHSLVWWFHNVGHIWSVWHTFVYKLHFWTFSFSFGSLASLYSYNCLIYNWCCVLFWRYAAVFAAFVAGMACSVGMDFSAKLMASLAKSFEVQFTCSKITRSSLLNFCFDL